MFTPIAGQWFNSEGNFDGALGNPAYQFTVTTSGVVVITLDSPDVGGVVLDLFDATGNRIARDDQHQPTAAVGADLAAGDYVVIAQNAQGGSGTFNITLEGPVAGFTGLLVDTDQDGTPDDIDPDDDGDGVLDEIDPAPLDRNIF